MNKCCTIPGCNRPTTTAKATLCNLHYLRVRRYGSPHTLLQVRDGRGKHPLHPAWCRMRWRARSAGQEVDPRWHDFWIFVAEAPAKPRGKRVFGRIDDSRPWQPGNVEWRKGQRRIGSRNKG